MALNIQNYFETVLALSKEKVIYTLASELFNKWLKKNCGESEIFVEIYYNYDSDFSDKGDT